MFNTAFGCFESAADAAYGIEEYCSADAAVSEAYDTAYDTFVDDEVSVYAIGAITADDIFNSMY